MSPAGATSPTHLDPIVASERDRGNVVRKSWSLETGPHGGLYTLELVYPIDLEAVRAEFELPDYITVRELPNGVTSLLDQRDGTGISGGPKKRDRRASRRRDEWWAAWRAQPRARTPIRNPSHREST